MRTTGETVKMTKNNKVLLASVFTALTAMTVVACGGGGGSGGTGGGQSASETVTVSLLGLNDFRGNLQPPSGSVTVADPANPAGTRVSAGGAAYLATLIKDLRAQNPNNTLVVGAGDFIGASPLTSSLFHDEPTIDALNLLGLDITSVGDHEFAKGRDELLRMQNGGCFPLASDGSKGNVGVDTCMTGGKFTGAKFKYLAANVNDQATGKTLFPAYEVRKVGGVDVAFVGLTLKDTPSVVPPGGVTGLTFADEVATVNNLVPELKAKGVASILVLLHQGGFTTASTVNDKTCPGVNGAIVALTDQLDAAIDVVISGHSQQEYVCTRPDGKLLTQAGFYGRIVTKIDLKIDPVQKKVVGKEANNIVVINDVGVKNSSGVLIPLPAGMKALAKDSAMAALMQKYVDASPAITNAVVGNIAALLTRTVNSADESQMGDVVADVYLAGSSGAAYGSKAAEIAFVNRGGLRADLTTSFSVTFGQLFAVMPFGNNLTTMDLTGQQILRLLEQQWEAPQPAGGRVMPISNGFSYTWDASKPEGAAAGAGNRVVAGSMQLNGVAIDLTKTYRVTVNNFMYSGGDNFTQLKAGTNVQQGGVDIDVAVAYFRAKGTVPTPLQNRISRIN